jgi:hypothetical protein
MHDFHVTFRDLLHAANLRHGNNGFTSPPKEGVLRIFTPFKNPTVSAGFEPANLGTKGQHATSRPPKPLQIYLNDTDKYALAIESRLCFSSFPSGHQENSQPSRRDCPDQKSLTTQRFRYSRPRNAIVNLSTAALRIVTCLEAANDRKLFSIFVEG